MSDSTAPSPSKTGWSDAERIALLVEIAMQKGGPDWKTLKLPTGRTKKACLHVWGKMKDIAATASGGANVEDHAAKNETEKKETAGVKRKAAATEPDKASRKSQKKATMNNDMDDDEEHVKVKGEPSDDEV